MKKEYFKITSVHRDDLAELGFSSAGVEDATMERLARMMADAYVASCFWDDLETVAESLNIRKK